MYLPGLLHIRTTNTDTLRPHVLLPLTSRTEKCGFVGNNDIYGPGIRIGIYAQILAVSFTNYFLISQVQILRDTVSIFSLAMVVICLIIAHSPADFYAVESFIILQILLYSCVMGVQVKCAYANIGFKNTLCRRLLNGAVVLSMASLHVWFWWAGLNQMKRTPCGTYLMYVVKTDMFGWAREVMKWLSLLMLIFRVYLDAVEGLRAWAFWRMRDTRKAFVEAVRRWTELQEKRRPNRTRIDAQVPDLDSPTHACFEESVSSSRLEPTSPQESDGEEFHTPLSSSDSFFREAFGTASSLPVASASTSASTISHRHAPDQDSPFPEFAILRQVYECGVFIERCISSTPYKENSNAKPASLLAIIRLICQPRHKQAKPQKPTTKTPTSTNISWMQCHLHILKAICTFRFPPHVFIAYSHLQKSREMDMFNGPFQTYAALTYFQATAIPPWPCVSLASSLLLTQHHAPQKNWLFWYYASSDLFIHGIVILQVELTLYWNRVSGLHSVWSSVGQLIPFIIGVAGLCLVGGRWIINWWEKVVGTKETPHSQRGTLEERRETTELFGLEVWVREGYARWKSDHEGERNDEE